MIRRLIAMLRRKPRPLEMHKLPWQSAVAVRRIAMGIDDTTRSAGRYGL